MVKLLPLRPQPIIANQGRDRTHNPSTVVATFTIIQWLPETPARLQTSNFSIPAETLTPLRLRYALSQARLSTQRQG